MCRTNPFLLLGYVSLEIVSNNKINIIREHLPNEGRKGPARIKKNTIYIYSFLTAEKDVQVAQNGGIDINGFVVV